MRETGMTIDELNATIATLARERQELRSAGADRAALEHNRRELVARQLELCHALIARYSARPADVAA